MANNSISEVVVNGNTYKIEADTSEIEDIKNALTTSLVATQNGSGTKSVTLDISTKNRIIAVSKNGTTLLHCIEIPTAILTNRLVIPLGKFGTSAKVVGISAGTAPQSTSTSSNLNGANLGIWQWSGGNEVTKPYNTANGNVIQDGKSIGLGVDLSSALNISSAKITYNGENSFTLTSVSGIEVSLYA